MKEELGHLKKKKRKRKFCVKCKVGLNSKIIKIITQIFLIKKKRKNFKNILKTRGCCPLKF